MSGDLYIDSSGYNLVGDVIVEANFRPMKYSTTTLAAQTLTVDGRYYGKIIFTTFAGETTITLPTNIPAAGSWFKVIQTVAQSLVVAAGTADTLVTVADATADSVSYSKAGACVLLISNGTAWIAINECDQTMTVTTA